MTNRQRICVELKAGDGGETAVSMTRWVKSRGEKAPWSEIPTATVAAEGSPGRRGSMIPKEPFPICTASLAMCISVVFAPLGSHGVEAPRKTTSGRFQPS